MAGPDRLKDNLSATRRSSFLAEAPDAPPSRAEQAYSAPTRTPEADELAAAVFGTTPLRAAPSAFQVADAGPAPIGGEVALYVHGMKLPGTAQPIPGWSSGDRLSACGHIAAEALERILRRDPDFDHIDEIKNIAVSRRLWDANVGMYGIDAKRALVAELGIETVNMSGFGGKTWMTLEAIASAGAEIHGLLIPQDAAR